MTKRQYKKRYHGYSRPSAAKTIRRNRHWLAQQIRWRHPTFNPCPVKPSKHKS